MRSDRRVPHPPIFFAPRSLFQTSVARRAAMLWVAVLTVSTSGAPATEPQRDAPEPVRACDGRGRRCGQYYTSWFGSGFPRRLSLEAIPKPLA